MKNFAIFVCAAILVTPSIRADDIRIECLLRGDCVVDTSGLVRAPGSDAIAAGTELPADEDEMFFCTLYHSTGCGPCKKLLEDWKTSEKLCALADPHTPRLAGTKCKFATVNIDDPTQAARVKPLKITKVPCVIIQTAKKEVNGILPDIVLCRLTGYGGDVDKYADALLAAFRRGLEQTPRTVSQSSVAAEPVEAARRFRPKIDPPITLERDPVEPEAGLEFNVEFPKSTVSKLDSLVGILQTGALWILGLLTVLVGIPIVVKIARFVIWALKPVWTWYVDVWRLRNGKEM